MLAVNIVVSWPRCPQVSVRRFGFLRGKSMGFEFPFEFIQSLVRQERLRC